MNKSYKENQMFKLNKYAREYIEHYDKKIDYQRIASQMKDFSNADYVMFFLFDEKGKDFTLLGFEGDKNNIKKAMDIIGYNIIGNKFDYIEEIHKKLEKSIITKVDSLKELIGIALPNFTVKIIERIFPIDHVLVVRITKDDKTVGSFNLIFSKNKDKNDDKMLKIFASQVGLFIDKKMYEEKSNKMKESLKNIIEGTNVGTWEHNIKTGKEVVNERWAEMLGYSLQEISSKTYEVWKKSIHPNDRKMIEEEFQRLINKKIEYYDVELRMKHKNGKWIWINDRGKVTKWTKDGEALLTSGTHTDITEKKKNEQKLLETKEKLENIIEGTNVGTWIWDIKSGEITVNSRWAEMLGYSLEELSPTRYETWENLTHAGDLEKVKDEIEKIFKKDIQYYDVEFRMKHKNGKWIWINSRSKVVKWSDDGDPLYMSGTHINITDRKESQEDLIQFNNLIQYIIKHNTSGIAVHDKNMNYMYVSEKYLKMFNIKDKNIIGKHHYEVFPDLPNRWRFVHKRSLKGEILSGNDDPFYREDGTLYWTKWESRPWYKKDDSIGGIIIYTEIINEKRKMEAEIYKEREQFKTTLLSVGDAIISTDRNGKIKIMNYVAEDLTGWKKEEAKNKSISKVFKIVNEVTREEILNPSKRVLLTGRTTKMENNNILISKNGKEIPIQHNESPIRDRTGNIVGVVVVFRDYTEKREKEKQIEYLNLHDHLTGLYNRRFFEEELKRLDTKRNLPLSILDIDVNGLKLTNDTFGHHEGDKILIKSAEAIKNNLRGDDIAARIGGDEFSVILPNCNNKEATAISNRFKEDIKDKSQIGIPFSLAIGINTKIKAEENIKDVLKKAESKMYENKLFSDQSKRREVIHTMLSTLHEKHPREEEHSKRVSELSLKIGKAINLKEDRLNLLKTAGLLHDIGKIAIDYSIIEKTGKLTETEYLEVKKHTEIGYRILKTSIEYEDIAKIVLYHHEKIDGEGYPEGIKGNEIPLESRIISIADAYDAMTSVRPYKFKIKKEDAIKELLKSSNTQFDQSLVKIFIDKVLL